MKHTFRIKQAVQFALKKHDGQYRKEKERWPYATHLVSVAILLGEAGASEDSIIAGLLHDTVEDTSTTGEEIEVMFGAHVRNLVEAVTEPPREGRTWRERKDAYLQGLKMASDDALIISIADKVDNIESKLEAYDREGEDFHGNWSQTPETYIWFHGEVARMAKERLPENPLTLRLVTATEREKALFGKRDEN